MGRLSKLKLGLSILLICFGTGLMAQEESEAEFQTELYKKYQQDGIDSAIESYRNTGSEKKFTFLNEPLNVLGYRLMGEGDLKAAEKAFLAQIEEHPEEANPYDSYADLLMEKGEQKKAKENYEKALLIAENIEDLEQQQQMFEASGSKLAKLAGKGFDFQFLEGKWKTKRYDVRNGEKSLPREGNINFTANEDNSVLTGVMRSVNDNYQGSRLIAYDAMDEEYDMALVSNTLTGIKTSTLKIDKSTPEEIVMMEEFEEDGTKKKLKHIIKKNTDMVKWNIHDLSNGQSSNLVVEMEFKKEK